MDTDKLQQLLQDVQSGDLSVDQAMERLRVLPYEDIGIARLDLHRALRTGRTDRALRTRVAGTTDCAADASQLGAALGAGTAGCPLCPFGTRTASRAGRTNRCRALRASAAGYALHTRRTGASHRAIRSGQARALSTGVADGTSRASCARRTCFSGTTDHHRPCGAGCTTRALNTGRSGRTGRARGACQCQARRAGGAGRASLADRAGRAVSTGRADIALSRSLGDWLGRSAGSDGKRRNHGEEQRASDDSVRNRCVSHGAFSYSY